MSAILYIDDVVPDGWGDGYAVKNISSLKDLREFSKSYYLVKSNFKVGLDLREADIRRMTPLLKLMEDSNLELILRVREPVPDTIISRSLKIIKKSKLESKSIVQALVGDETVTGQKIRQLR